MNLHTSILTALLQNMEQPFSIEYPLMVINPTSSSLLEILPGELVNGDDGTQLHLDLSTFDSTQWMADVINSLSKTI